MRRALELARTPPYTSPNPRVGALLVRDGAVVAEGAHEGRGTPHAEAVALGAIDAHGATLYVTLEPCIHHGLTPPCAPAVVRSGVQRVVIAMPDPDPRVNGRGIAHLREHGLDVTVGVLEDEARALNAAFVHHRITGRPLVALKLALSIDGRLAAPDGSARWITGPAARRRSHARRLEAGAVMVGAGTVLADDPSLTVRALPASRQPTRIIVDGRARVPPTARVFGAGEVLVLTTAAAPHESQRAYKEAGAEVVVLPGSPDGVDLRSAIEHLGRSRGPGRDLTEVLCEGGARLATSLLVHGLVDRLELHLGALMLGRGGPDIGPLSRTIEDARRWRLTEATRLADDLVAVYGPRRPAD